MSFSRYFPPARCHTGCFRPPEPTPKSLTADRLQALLQMQKTDAFCKWISKHLSNGKAPQHETDLFIHVKGLLYKYVTDSKKNS